MPTFENHMVLDLHNAPWNTDGEPISEEYTCPKCGETLNKLLLNIQNEVLCRSCNYQDSEELFFNQ